MTEGTAITEQRAAELREQLRNWAAELGFQQIGITGIDLSEHKPRLQAWLTEGLHGSMGYMARHQGARLHPEQLQSGTVRVVSARMNYLHDAESPVRLLDAGEQAYISRYALGRDYHKVLRRRLAKLAKRLDAAAGEGRYRFRALTDSAPVLEKALARNAGLGWVGKHTLVIHPQVGSFFFLGEIYTDLPLPIDDEVVDDQCGSCRACMTVCPTDAIVADKVLDARRCISYLTIEHKGAIDPELRPLMGNRVFGCDDCQLFCPWNRTPEHSDEDDFQPRDDLAQGDLLTLFAWDEATFLKRTEGSAIRRLSYPMWQRNLAIAIGNGPPSRASLSALEHSLPNASPLAAEHIRWAIEQLQAKASGQG